MGSFAIFTGLLGMLTARVKNCFTIGMFSFISMIAFVAFFAFGAILISVAIASRYAVDDYCSENTKNEFTTNFSQTFVDLIEEVEKSSGDMLSKYMCSDACPCVQVDRSKWGSRALEISDPTRYDFTG